MDVVFVLGAAGEGADTVYNKNKQIITKFIEANKVPFTMYSLVDYGPKAIVRSKFGDTKHYAELSDQVEKLERPGEGKALDKVCFKVPVCHDILTDCSSVVQILIWHLCDKSGFDKGCDGAYTSNNYHTQCLSR